LGACRGNEIAATGANNSKRVPDMMATAAAAPEWPAQIVDAARAQMQSINQMQINAMDHIMSTWERQLKIAEPNECLTCQ
jgi:hypothetical protein